MYDDPARDILFGPERPRHPASDARLRAMAAQLRLARGEWDDELLVPRRTVLMELARRSLSVGDQATLVGMAQSEEESTC